MFKILMYIGFALFLPGLCALGYSIYAGPESWSTGADTFWGAPISLFVFWIGLAHAGTLLSAIFLSLGIRLDKRTAMLAELSTLCCLAIAAVFPLMHLGVIENFFMVIPFVDARGNFANVRSPLVWDFACIASYALLSLVFFWTHIKSGEHPAFGNLRRPMAWLLFPLVLWVHSVVSLDFATALVPEWKGAFFPIYFIVGAILSGIALVNALLCTEGYRVRLLERLMLASSWILLVIWLWDYLLKGEFCVTAFVFAGVLPQLLIVERFRDNRIIRFILSLSILYGLLDERFFIVMPSFRASFALSYVDYGLVAFSMGAFILLFFGLRHALSRYISGEGAFFGEIDGSDMAPSDEEPKSIVQLAPWASEELKMLRYPLLVGILVAILFTVWSLGQRVFDYTDISVVNILAVIYPIIAVVAFIALYVKFFMDNPKEMNLSGRNGWILVVCVIVLSFIVGLFYAGGNSLTEPEDFHDAASRSYESENVRNSVSFSRAKLLWNAKCATCHGVDGMFNEKFVREYYPVPTKLDSLRVDSLGVDSLTKVILNGRGNMNAYRGRLSEIEARALVEYMRLLAVKSTEAQLRSNREVNK